MAFCSESTAREFNVSSEGAMQYRTEKGQNAVERRLVAYEIERADMNNKGRPLYRPTDYSGFLRGMVIRVSDSLLKLIIIS